MDLSLRHLAPAIDDHLRRYISPQPRADAVANTFAQIASLPDVEDVQAHDLAAAMRFVALETLSDDNAAIHGRAKTLHEIAELIGATISTSGCGGEGQPLRALPWWRAQLMAFATPVDDREAHMYRVAVRELHILKPPF